MIVTIILLFVILGIGTALMNTARGQQTSSANELASEKSYSLAEAALNAEVYQLSISWPTRYNATLSPYPSSCSSAGNNASYCPSPSDLSSAYSSNSASCPTGTPGDAWSSSAPTNTGWTTYVRDAGTSSSTQSLFQSATEKTMAAYDASANGYVWVRSVATVNCHTAVVVSKVSEQVVHLNFPSMVVNANGFETSNNGNKQIIDTQGTAAQPSNISLRCNGLGGQPPSSSCAQYGQSAQVSPGPTYASPSSQTPTLSSTQLAAAKAQAISNGTYFAAGNCPTTMAQLTGSPVYVEGPCNLSFTGNDTANSASSPGCLILVNGTLYLGGTVTFYGVIYAVNAQGSSGDVVTTHGNAYVQGGIDVDGNGTVNFGSSGKPNISYGPSAFSGLKAFGGAALTPNTYRQLPVTQ